MAAKKPSPHVHTPKNLNTLLALYQKLPEAQLYAGGTGILWNQNLPEPELAPEVISLDGVAELKNISRTESYLEIGAAVPLNRILGIGRHVLASSFYTALTQVGNPVVRNFATLGGNLARKDFWMDLIPPLLLLDVRLELRRQGNSEWIPMVKFLERSPLFHEGELITRIRIPLEEWNIQHYRRFRPEEFGEGNDLTFCVLANVQKGYINRFRLALGAHRNLIIRNREMENAVEGKKLPLNSRDIVPLQELLQQTLENVQPALSPLQKTLITRSILWFLLRHMENSGDRPA